MLSDLKYAARSLLRTPSFTAVAVFTLALGIGATVAIFSMVNGVLLRPLPYWQPERLARIYTEIPILGLRRFGVSKTEYLEIRREAKSWQSIDGWLTAGANITAGTGPMRVAASFVTGGLLSSLHATPALGRPILPQEDEPGAAPVAVLSHGLWQRAFGADRSVIGREVLLNGRKYIIVGVMPADFRFPLGDPAAVEIWAPLVIDRANPGERSNHILNLVGRLKPGVTLHEAQAEADSLVEYWGKQQIRDRFDPRYHTILLRDFREEIVSGIRPALRVLFGAVCFLLLIACVNVANLLLARAEHRQREVAIRAALGAGIGRLARQFLIEGILLALLGAAIGLVLAQAGLRVATSMASDIPRTLSIGIDWRVVLFTLTVSVLAGVLAGLAPIVHVLRRGPQDGMKSASASTTDAVGTQHFRQALIVSQLALALVLLTGTGLMLRAFWKLQQVDAGFDPHGVVTMSVSLPETTYSGEAARDLWARLEERLELLPGVRNVAFTSALPPVQPPFYTTTWIEGFVASEKMPVPTADFYQVISRGYFDTLRVGMMQGRSFDRRDGPDAPPVAIVNQTMAQMYWQNGDAVGRRVRPYLSEEWYTVIGVVADVKNFGVDKPTGTAIYLPYAQAASHNSVLKDFLLKSMYVTVRSSRDPAAIVSAVRKEVSRIDPALPLASVRTMEEVMSEAQSRPRFLALVLSLFAGIALTLAAVGIYGVISYAVAQRTKEFGIRMALGAQHGQVLRLVLRRGLLLIACGIVIGLAGSFLATRALAGWLFGVTATDPATFAAVAVLLSAIAVIASYMPARRATKVDPLVALRAE